MNKDLEQFRALRAELSTIEARLIEKAIAFAEALGDDIPSNDPKCYWMEANNSLDDAHLIHYKHPTEYTIMDERESFWVPSYIFDHEVSEMNAVAAKYLQKIEEEIQRVRQEAEEKRRQNENEAFEARLKEVKEAAQKRGRDIS